MTELDIENHSSLIEYLRQAGRLGADECPEIQTLAGGVSNRTVLVRRGAGASWVIKQALPKLRVEVDWFCDTGRVHREAMGLKWLERLLPAGSVPGYVAEDRENLLLIMQAVAEPHENWKSQLLAGKIERESVSQFARMLGEIHRQSDERSDELQAEFQDQSYFEALRLEPYYTFAAERVPEAGDFLRSLLRETSLRRQTLVHGDYSPKNVLVHRGRLILLDHEVIHWGDPAFDVGFSLTHLLSKAHYLPDHRARFAEAAQLYWRTYRDMIGDGPWQQRLEPYAIRHTLGCLLARVAGRSPLEYLREQERVAQQRAVCGLLDKLPTNIEELVTEFLGGLR